MSAIGIIGVCVGGYLFSLLSVFSGMILWWLKNECWRGHTYTYFDFVDYCKETHIVPYDVFGGIWNKKEHNHFWFWNMFIFFSWFPGLNTLFAVGWWIYWICYLVGKVLKYVYGFWKNMFLKRLKFKV